ncbi:MAG TPA: N-acetylmuramoyl-L-alanine amidase [Rhabdochlamydiaceae bacterium]|nr:N-acetylmuramoyl-L-alanine amidase [Rhabdochlamydiaceae bacterium]
MFYFILFLFLPCLISAKDFSDFDRYQKKLSREIVQKKIDTFLKKNAEIDAYYQLTEKALILYKTPKTEVEYILELEEQAVPSENLKKKSLAGLKVALDPGHFGGNYAFLEERYIDIEENRFDEGTLTLLTALYLKQLLEAEGATVFLTKTKVGEGVFEENFFDWLKKNPHYWVDKPLNRIFRLYYNPLDLRARAEKINQFGPDLTLIIHFNAHPVKGDLPSNSHSTESNYNLVFLPGAFCKKELADSDARYEFLRLICTHDLQNSLDLSQHILDRFSAILKVPAIQESSEIPYLSKCCLKLSEGIFARNLVLTRLIHGPLCYGETLIQNNVQECKNLSKKEFVIQGIACPLRLKEVAEAYFEGIKEYLK